MEILPILQRLGVALGLGLLVGLQRQRTEARLAGFRTFPLVTVFGSFCALLAENFGGWTVASGLVALAAIALSMSQMVTSDKVDARTGWRIIVVASLSNLAFKTLIVGFLGSGKLLRKISGLFALGFLAGVLLLWLWPD